MLYNKMLLLISVFILSLTPRLYASEEEVSNNQYHLRLLDDNSVEVRIDGVKSYLLKPEFVVMYSDRNPGFGLNRAGRFDISYPDFYPGTGKHATRWAFYNDDPSDPEKELRDHRVDNNEIRIDLDSRGERYFTYNSAGEEITEHERLSFKGTINPFHAGRMTTMNAVSSKLVGNTIHWGFEQQDGFEFIASLMLPENEGDPMIKLEMKTKKDGYYSVGFIGCPWVDGKEAIRIPQKTADGRNLNCLLTEAKIALPRVHTATKSQVNSALVIDPKESPFRHLHDSKGMWTYSQEEESTSRFGMMLQVDGENNQKPVAFMPVMGGYESKMKKGQTYNFTLRYVLRKEDWKETYRYIARSIYGFRDMRDNSGSGSINSTAENIMDYISPRDTNNYSMWHEEQKYYNYWSDQSGIFKPFTPLFTLAAAILTDDEDFYWNRALPIVEYSLSRDYNMFNPYDIPETYMARSKRDDLGEPYVDVSQLVSMYSMYQRNTYAFKLLAEQKGFDENDYIHVLSLYDLTGDEKYIKQAIALTDGKSGGGSYMDWLELYEKTGLPQHLENASLAAYNKISNYNLFPAVPDKKIKVDVGDKAPIHGHAYQRHEDWGFAPPKSMYAKEQTVPAWRLSEVGVQWEVYRYGQWPWVHGQFMRVAAHTDDEFLRDMQRWAMVGRYGNYCGDFRSARHSLVGEQADAPMKYIYDTNFSTFNPGHACEWIGAVMDFMFADCFERSDMKIDFPSHHMYKSPFRTKCYGDRAGRFYDDKNVIPWMPRKLVDANTKQVDYLSAYGNGNFYIVFWNQSFKPQKVTVKIDQGRVDFQDTHAATVWIENEKVGTQVVSQNTLNFDVAAKGITAFKIEGAEVKTTLHKKIYDPASPILGQNSVDQSEASFGKVNGMILSMGRGLTNAFIYTDAKPKNVIVSTLRYRQANGEWKELTDDIFPYEFSVKLDEKAGDFEYQMIIENAKQKLEISEIVKLKI